MIILDTNIISELLRPRPEPRVVAWVEVRPNSQFFTTTITEAEIRYGVARLDDGSRRQNLQKAVDGLFAVDLVSRVLAFDSVAAISYAQIVAKRERAGRPISHFDAQISAIAIAYGASIATRNVKDFEGLGLDIINPWER